MQHAPANPTRDRTLDGFRAAAALGVVIAHAIAYRFGGTAFPGSHYLQRLADPLAQSSVQIFFVISGYIITTLLLKEERLNGHFSLPAFYVRRTCRIIPPLALVIATTVTLAAFGYIRLDAPSVVAATTFTCNVGVVECQWWVAHTWSLAVEEQYYLLWPLLLLLVPSRTAILVAGIISLLATFLIAPLAWHSNYISFACIGAGALVASSEKVLSAIARLSHILPWIAAVALLLIGPLYIPAKAMQFLMPAIVVYVVFAARELAPVNALLRLQCFQAIGAASYSLYLWQQLFLAKPETYLAEPLPLWILPIVVAGSVFFVERPFIRLGHILSKRLILGTRLDSVHSG